MRSWDSKIGFHNYPHKITCIILRDEISARQQREYQKRWVWPTTADTRLESKWLRMTVHLNNGYILLLLNVVGCHFCWYSESVLHKAFSMVLKHQQSRKTSEKKRKRADKTQKTETQMKNATPMNNRRKCTDLGSVLSRLPWRHNSMKNKTRCNVQPSDGIMLNSTTDCVDCNRLRCLSLEHNAYAAWNAWTQSNCAVITSRSLSVIIQIERLR